jgi:hypothetical protein
MIIDNQLLFSSNQALTASADSDNIIDLQNARDMGIGDNPALKLFVQVTTAFLTTNAGTVQVAIQGSTDNTTYTNYALSDSTAYTTASMTAGSRLFDIDMPRPKGGAALPRYLKLRYTIANTFTQGKVSAGLVLDRNDYVAYPSGYTVAN